MADSCTDCPFLDIDPADESEAYNFDTAIAHTRALSTRVNLRREGRQAADAHGNARLLTALQLLEEALIRLRRAQEITKEVPNNG